MWVMWKFFVIEWWVNVQHSRTILGEMQFTVNNKIESSSNIYWLSAHIQMKGHFASDFHPSNAPDIEQVTEEGENIWTSPQCPFLANPSTRQFHIYYLINLRINNKTINLKERFLIKKSETWKVSISTTTDEKISDQWFPKVTQLMANSEIEPNSNF